MPDYEFGSDGQSHPVAQPLAKVAAAQPLTASDPFEASEPGAAAQLRAFEDHVFGADHPRINDQIERGIGSRFSNLDDNHKAHHAALEALIAAENEHQAAVGAADIAAAKLEAAAARVDQTKGAV